MPNGCSSKPWPEHERARAGILGAASKSLYPHLHMTSPASPIGVFDSGVGGLSVLRALLHGEEVDYALPGTPEGEKSDIRFLHPDEGFIDVAQPVPIYVAAASPFLLGEHVGWRRWTAA